MANKPKVKITDIEEHENCVTIYVELDVNGDGTDIREESLNMGWRVMDLEPRGKFKGKPHYQQVVRNWAMKQIDIIKRKEELRRNKPDFSKGKEEFEVPDKFLTND